MRKHQFLTAAVMVSAICGTALSQSNLRGGAASSALERQAALGSDSDMVSVEITPADDFTFGDIMSDTYPDRVATSTGTLRPASVYSFSLENVTLSGTGFIGGFLGGEGVTIPLEELLFDPADGLLSDGDDQTTLLLSEFLVESGAGRNIDEDDTFTALEFTIDGTAEDLLVLLAPILGFDAEDPESLLGFINIFVDPDIALDDPFSIDLFVGVNAGTVELSITNINVPIPPSFIGTATIETATFTLSAIDLPLQISEFTFDGGDFSRDPESTGAAEIRHLDDAPFAPFLADEEAAAVPDPAIPAGVTDAQDDFMTTASLGIDGPGGEEDTVYVTSPPRNLNLPSPLPARPAEAPALEVGESREGDFSRTIGLSLWPNTRPEFPSPLIPDFTFVWDVFIPQETFDNAQPYPMVMVDEVDNGTGEEGADGIPDVDMNGDPIMERLRPDAPAGARVIGHLLNDEPDGQDEGLITLIRIPQDSDGDGVDDILLGLQDEDRYGPEDADGNPTLVPTGIVPGKWNRIAFTNRFLPLPTGTRTALFVNGTLLYEVVPTGNLDFSSTADFIFSAFDPSDPAFPPTEFDANGMPLPGAAVTTDQLDQWDDFPNPFAQSIDPTDPANEGEIPAQLLSTATLFSDGEQGLGGSLFIANAAFVDGEVTDSEIAALGGPDADGIFFVPQSCVPADIAAPFGLLDGADVNAFITAFGGGDDLADLNGDEVVDGADVNAFITQFGAGCP